MVLSPHGSRFTCVRVLVPPPQDMMASNTLKRAPEGCVPTPEHHFWGVHPKLWVTPLFSALASCSDHAEEEEDGVSPWAG